MAQVNHPKHYNQHPAGIECIDIIRHYTCDIANALKYVWRAGLKPELGKEDAEKEVEDLNKAMWYIEDFCKVIVKNGAFPGVVRRAAEYDQVFNNTTGHTIDEVISPYADNVKEIMQQLLRIGIYSKGCMVISSDFDVRKLVNAIKTRIGQVYCKDAEQNIKEMKQMLHGEMVEGTDFARPGGERDTEPDDYDPLNIIIQAGEAYCLDDGIRKKPNGGIYSPCEMCALRWQCDEDGTNSPCELLNARNSQYCRNVGRARYNRHFGTIEIVDELKESLKNQEEE